MPEGGFDLFDPEWAPVGATHVELPDGGVGRWQILMAKVSLEDGVTYRVRAESDLPTKPADRDAIPVGSTYRGAVAGKPDWTVLVAWPHPENGWQFAESTPEIDGSYNRAEDSPVQIR